MADAFCRRRLCASGAGEDAKLATRLVSVLAMKLKQALVLTTLLPGSVQFTKLQHGLAVAHTVMFDPHATAPPPLVEPLSGGEELVLIMLVSSAKLATR